MNRLIEVWNAVAGVSIDLAYARLQGMLRKEGKLFGVAVGIEDRRGIVKDELVKLGSELTQDEREAHLSRFRKVVLDELGNEEDVHAVWGQASKEKSLRLLNDMEKAFSGEKLQDCWDEFCKDPITKTSLFLFQHLIIRLSVPGKVKDKAFKDSIRKETLQKVALQGEGEEATCPGLPGSYRLDSETKDVLSRLHAINDDELMEVTTNWKVPYESAEGFREKARLYVNKLFEDYGEKKRPRYKFKPNGLAPEEWKEFENGLNRTKILLKTQGGQIRAIREAEGEGGIWDLWKSVLVDVVATSNGSVTLCSASDCNKLFNYFGKPAAYCSKSCYDKDFRRREYLLNPELPRKRIQDWRKKKEH